MCVCACLPNLAVCSLHLSRRLEYSALVQFPSSAWTAISGGDSYVGRGQLYRAGTDGPLHAQDKRQLCLELLLTNLILYCTVLYCTVLDIIIFRSRSCESVRARGSLRPTRMRLRLGIIIIRL